MTPYWEPLRTTLTRTGLIAIVAGTVVAWFWGGVSRWPVAALIAFWPAFGGHWVELWFLNRLRPRLSQARRVHVAARIAVWFVAGVLLVTGMGLTATVLIGYRPLGLSLWWRGGFGFIAIELLVHLALQLRGQPSFYNGRG